MSEFSCEDLREKSPLPETHSWQSVKTVRQPVQINQFGRTDGHHRKPKSSEMSQLAELKLFDQFGSTKFSDFPQVRKSVRSVQTDRTPSVCPIGSCSNIWISYGVHPSGRNDSLIWFSVKRGFFLVPIESKIMTEGGILLKNPSKLKEFSEECHSV